MTKMELKFCTLVCFKMPNIKILSVKKMTSQYTFDGVNCQNLILFFIRPGDSDKLEISVYCLYI